MRSETFGYVRPHSGDFGRARLCPAALRQFGFSRDEKPLTRMRLSSRLVTSRRGLGFQTLTGQAGGGGRGAGGGALFRGGQRLTQPPALRREA